MVALIVMITVMIMIMRKCTVSLITFYSKSNLNYLQLLTVGWAAHHQTLCGWNRTSENKDGMSALFVFVTFWLSIVALISSSTFCQYNLIILM